MSPSHALSIASTPSYSEVLKWVLCKHVAADPIAFTTPWRAKQLEGESAAV
jgi:hypothetical protein